MFGRLFALAAVVVLGGCSSGHDEGSRADPDAGAPKIDRRNDGHAWLVDNGGGFCLSWLGVVDAPASAASGTMWLGAGQGLFPIDTRNPEQAFPIDMKAIERGPVRAFHRSGGDVFVVFGDAEVVQYDASGNRAGLGRLSTPIAVSDNGCTAMRRDDELVVRRPGEPGFTPVGLPRPKNGFRIEIKAAVGLADAILVRTYRDENDLGSLQRVACPSLEVTKITGGNEVINLGTFVRDERRRIWGVDRYNGDKGATNYRLVRSDDDGKTFAAVPVPDGWQSSVIAARGNWIAVAPPKLAALMWSSDAGEHWTVERLDTYSSVADFSALSLHVSDGGIVTAGADCNYLVHRRAPLPR